MLKPLPFSGGVAPSFTRPPKAVEGAARMLSPKAAATLRRSIDERLMPSSSSLAQNSISWAS
jgi:hypothetical protein